MAKAVAKAKSKDPYRWQAVQWRTRNQWLEWEKVGMRPSMDLEDLKLRWVNARDLDVKAAIVSLRITRTIEGASTVTMIVRDPHGHIMSEDAKRVHRRSRNPPPVDEDWKPLKAPDMTGKAVELILDDVVFRLSKVEGNFSNAEMTLVFEDRIIYWLRRKKGRKKSASRAQATRAQFILSLLREVKAEKVPFVCPELAVKQRIKSVENGNGTAVSAAAGSLSGFRAMIATEEQIAANPMPRRPIGDSVLTPPPETTAPREAGDDDGAGGFRSNATLTVKGHTATHEQKRNMDTVIATAAGVNGATDRTIVSAIEAVIVESEVKNLDHGDQTSTGILQVLASTGQALGVDPMDIEDCVTAFMEKGFYKGGGAIRNGRDHPDWRSGQIAQNVQGSAHPNEYDRWEDESKRWLAAWKGEGLTATGGGTYRKSYQYTRDKNEDSWTCMKRLADEVQWRVFMVGRAMYYMSEKQLFQRRVRYHLKPTDPAVVEFNWTMDWNRPTNESTLTVVLERWGAPPGSVIMAEGFGMPDGRWLVTEVERDWFSPLADVTIAQPLPELAEPAPETGTHEQGVSGEGTDGDIGRLYDVCKHISDITPGYLYGGGHGPPLSSLRGDQALDCSSSCSLALYRAGMWDDNRYKTARVSGDFDTWGAPGPGHLFTVKYNSGHVWIKFEDASGMMYKRFDTGGPQGGAGPKMRTTPRPESGFKERHWPDM